MSERLTDEQVADLADPSLDEIWGCEDVNTLAREVQEYRALRPTCPTCDGSGCLYRLNAAMDSPCNCCPDCPDGKMPLPQWVALLVRTLTEAREVASWAVLRSDLSGDLAAIDAVLKMAVQP